MSDEEKKAIESFKEENNNDLSRFDDFNSYTQFKIKRDKLIIELIEKQQKEIEEYKDKFSDEKIRNTVIKRYKEVIEKDYIDKDKIKAKIKEAEKIIKEDRKELNFGTTLRDDILQGIVYKIDFNTRLKNILESLLKKE